MLIKEILDNKIEINDLNEIEKIAKIKLSESAFNYFSGGANDEISLKRNRAVFEEYFIYNRVLKGNFNVNTSVEFFETKINSPIMIAPMAYHKLVSKKGEESTAEGASNFNTIFVTSMFSTTNLKTIIQKSKNLPWLQVYLLKDKKLTEDIVHYSKNLGIKTIVLTIDAPIYGKKNKQTNLILPSNLKIGLFEEIKYTIPKKENLAEYCFNALKPDICWDDIDWLYNKTKARIILKGICNTADFYTAIKNKYVKGIILSNHGGRQLDFSPSAIDILKTINFNKVPKDFIVMVDGGIRRGSDIFKALALGAKGVLIGRPIAYGLAFNEEKGVQKVLQILQEELMAVMKFTGCENLKDINENLLLTKG